MGRRGRHEGSIYLRAGRWVGVVDLGWIDGKRSRRYYYGATRRAVQDRLDDARRAVAEGRPVPSERLTVEAFLTDWLESVKPALRPTTWESYEWHVRLHIAPAIGRTSLARLSPAQVQKMLAGLSARGLAPQTVKNARATLRRALGFAERWGLVARNVARLTDPPRVVRPEVHPLDPAELAVLLDGLGDDRLGPLIITAVGTGLRQAELLGLTWDAVDLEAGALTVSRSLGRVDGRYVLGETKTGKRRTLVLPPSVVEALRRQRLLQLRDRLVAGSRWKGNALGLVFASRTGAPLGGTVVTPCFQAILRRLGLRRVRFHDLRHGCATLLLAAGVPARVVQEQLGHSTIAVTMNIYAHVLPALQRDAAAAMEAALRAGRSS